MPYLNSLPKEESLIYNYLYKLHMSKLEDYPSHFLTKVTNTS